MSLLDELPIVPVASEASRRSQGTESSPAPRTTMVPLTGVPMQRRSFVRAVALGGTTLAVTLLGWVSAAVPAFAVTRTSRSPVHCIGYNTPGGDVPCWGRTFISSAYCAADHYHRIDSVTSGSNLYVYGWDAACASYAGWYWTGPTSGYNCWDGHVTIYNGSSGTYYTSCCKYRTF